MISSEEIEQRRSPVELREFVCEVQQNVKSDDVERYRGIQKKDVYKLFVDEIIPLSYFAIFQYPDSYKILPVIGNQGYDALVFDENGKEVERVEITIPHNGAAMAEDARLIVKNGYGQIHITGEHTGLKDKSLNDITPHVLDACKKKSEKDYSDCVLVIAISPNPPFPSHEIGYEEQIGILVQQIKNIKFNARQVFLLILPCKVFYDNDYQEYDPLIHQCG